MYLLESTRRIKIEDVGVTVDPHNPVWVTDEQYLHSICIREHEKTGALRATPKNPARVMKPAGPPKKRKPLISTVKWNTRVQHPVPPKPGEEIVTLTKKELQEELRAAEDRGFKRAVELLGAQASPAPPAEPAASVAAPAPELDTRSLVAEITAGIKKELQEGLRDIKVQTVVQGAVPQKPSTAHSDGPMFIPSGIVQAGEGAEIAVESSSSSKGNLDSAAEALKKLRKKRGKKTDG